MRIKAFVRVLFGLVVLSSGPARAELPLPDATVHGTILDSDSQPVSSGDVTGAVERGGQPVLVATGQFVTDAQGIAHYVLPVPLETAVGAPGPSGVAAREGDVLVAIRLDGVVVATPNQPLSAGLVVEVEGSLPDGQSDVFQRGDCNSDRRLDVSDVVKLLVFLFRDGSEPTCRRACDTNDDEILDLADAAFSLAFLFQGGELPPPPSVTCGAAPSSPGITCESSPCP